jgi:hypothetical protein
MGQFGSRRIEAARAWVKAFNVFAAPEDLTDESGKKLVATFKDTAQAHDGIAELARPRWRRLRRTIRRLYWGLSDGSAIGKWFIPTRDLLIGNGC